MVRKWGGVAAVLMVCLLTGCTKKTSVPLAPASGVVTLNGKPLENARVNFYPKESSSRFSYGTTDAEGRFKLSTFGVNDGAIIGAHTVTISKVDSATEGKVDLEKLKKTGYYGDGMPGYESMMGLGGKPKIEVKNEVPAKYSDKASSTLEASITAEGPNEYNFNLE